MGRPRKNPVVGEEVEMSDTSALQVHPAVHGWLRTLPDNEAELDEWLGVLKGILKRLCTERQSDVPAQVG
jgi:hypothetical protein